MQPAVIFGKFGLRSNVKSVSQSGPSWTLRAKLKILLLFCGLLVSCKTKKQDTQALVASGPSGPALTGSNQTLYTNPMTPPVQSSSMPYASTMPLPTPHSPLMDTYVVRYGDTLGSISLAYDVSIDELLHFNNLGSASAIIQVDQVLKIPLNNVSRIGSAIPLLPDSEVVYSPAYLDFDVEAFVSQRGGFLAGYSEMVDGVQKNGAEIVEQVARQYSVGPRVLLALLEYYGGWIVNYQPLLYHSLGPANPYYEQSFFLQLSWAANRVNQGYYGYKQSGSIAVRFRDGSRAIVPAGLNAGTVGVQNILAVNGDWETWEGEMQAFMGIYHHLFGDPFVLAVEPLIPYDLVQPPLSLPWEVGQTFYYTGGPHAAYGLRSAWAAVDFAPPDVNGSCYYSQAYITAAADGRLFLGNTGEMYLDLDGDGSLQTGWVLLYLHTVAREGLSHGQLVSAGTSLGYASCEGGIATSSHLHLARRYNGEWMAADGPLPLVLSGWQVQVGLAQYDGTMIRDGIVKTACECRDETVNALVGE